jgi:ABC-type multidrug transport system ATPase subunit
VSKIFGRFAAVRDISAQFEAGRLYAIFGDNGAGKSTLLRVICGLARATRGDVRIFGQLPRRATLRLGYMAHAPLLYDEMTGMENLRYFAGLYGIDSEGHCEQAMRGVGLDPELPRRVGEYSQGMRQRLSLARATLHDPEIVLLDEPFSNLDPHSAQAMAALLGAMRDSGRTLLIVTHQAGHLAGVADESLWMSAGGIAARAPGVGAAAGVRS